ncbi:MAG: alpha/beta hydrolase [Acidobacteriota bacterium]|nr:alpha/beta hydrolase [Acidobacteriota bacterium]
MYETCFPLGDGEEIFVRLNRKILDPTKANMVFLHGLGETSYCFREAFQAPELKDMNLIAPDLLGYGQSTGAADNDYSFQAQIRRLYQLLDELNIGEFSLVGHSMGGDIGTLMCREDKTGRIQHFIDIEGNLTEADQNFTNLALQHREDFNYWFPGGLIDKLNERGDADRPSIERYKEALHFCQPEAFLESAEEIARHNAPPEQKGDRMGRRLADLTIPTLYLHGDDLPHRTRRFLHDSTIRFCRFGEAGHWVMIDRGDILYPTVAAFCKSEHGVPLNGF